MTRRALLLLCLFAAGLGPRAGAQDELVPLVAAFAFGGSGGAVVAVDSGPLHLASDQKNLKPVAGPHGPAARFDGSASFFQVADARLDDLVAGFTVTCWLQVERFPAKGGSNLVTKGGNSGWQLGLGDARQLYFHGSWGGGWYQSPWKGQIPPGAWVHVALTFQKGGQARVYLQGGLVTTDETPFAAWKMHEPLRVGGTDWTGAIADLRLYAAALTPAQVAAEAQGQALPTRATTPADFPAQGYPVRLSLGRFDMPLAAAAYDARRLQTAARLPAPDATDWPVLKWNGEPLFRDGPTQNVEVPLLKGSDAKSLFRTPKDNVIDPIDHWFRANEFLWGRTYVYTTDRTARTASGDYELWVFPIEIRPDGDRPIEQVQLTLGGETTYQREEKLRTLTLLLPANLTGAPYCLSVNGSDPVEFSVGLQPVQPGHPEDRPIEVHLQIPGFTVANAAHPSVFPHQKAWDADWQALGKELPPPTAGPALTGFGRYLGLAVPRSPIGIFTTSMRAGMSGGHYFQEGHVRGFAGTPEDYAAHLAANGYDFAIDDAEPKTLDGGTRFEEWLGAMARHGLKAGANPAIPGNLDILGNPNLAFQSTYLPEWGAPAYRDAQLLTQRFGRFPSFLGLLIGADNAGYVTYWDWAPTIPDRPWGRAWLQFQEGHSPKAPVGPALSPSKSYETRGTQREFLDYIKRYDETFSRYTYFAQAVREVKPEAILTTGSYGSSPGVGGRGGWPWATIPALMNASLPVQTAYDWNELGSSKPLHNVALIDRLRSTYPDKPTWALIDDFGLFFGREARQRAYALALTRGVQAIGTTFLAHQTGDEKWHADAVTSEPRPRGPILAEQKELYDWIHRYGGIWQGTRPLASIGVLYVQPQAISRSTVGGDNPDAKALLHGSHEGKTTEALFFCHMAGWPAKIVTPEELKRGIPPEMKTLLLTGLNRFDQTWVWFEGLEPQLRAFVAAGGKLILDDESVVPGGLAATHAELHVAAYITQTRTDASPLLLARNRANAVALRKAMEGSEPPVAISPSDTVWAVPHQTREVQYIAVVNWASEPNQNASQVVHGQIGALAWHTPRPIYDLRIGRKITEEEAAHVDLTKDGARVYALPPREISAPSLKVAYSAAIGLYQASVTPGCAGVPVQIVLRHDGETATVFGASGTPVSLPIGPSDSGTYDIQATELLTGLLTSISFTAVALAPTPTTADPALRRFAQRREVPLTIALTPGQENDPALKKTVDSLTAFYSKSGRHVELGRIEPNGVILSLQPLRSIEKYPQWRTIASDLVLLGSPKDNLLLLDQARGGLLPEPSPAGAAVITYSPFVGEFQVLNLLAPDPAGVGRAASQIIAP